MAAENINKSPKVKKETKNKIKVDFERAPFWERFKAKFLSTFFLQKVVWYIFRLLLLIGIAYVVLFPFFTKIAGSFMGPDDFVDVTVRLIPKTFTLNTYKAILLENDYLQAFTSTLTLSLMAALLQTFVCSLIAYGLAKFKFKGNKLVFMLVIFTMVVPHQTIQYSMFMNFRFFDIFTIGDFGLLRLLSGGASVGIEGIDKILHQINILDLKDHALNLTNTYWPLAILSATGLGFKNGLYIFMLKQFFTGIPDELEESAYLDGANNARTFFQIILPISVPMMITVFLFAFCWQWTDNFYTDVFFPSSKTILMPDIIAIPQSLKIEYAGQGMYYAAIRNACGILIILPLVILYLFCQRYLVQGIERSGLTAD